MRRVRLFELCEKGSSNLRQKDLEKEGPYPVFGASGLCGYSCSYQHKNPYVGMVKDGAGVGRCNVCPGESSVLGTMQALMPNEDVSVEYLYYLVSSLQLGEGFTGSTIPHIYFKDYGKRMVPLHSSEEQCRITLNLTRIDAVLDQLNQLVHRYDHLIKSRFIEMFENASCVDVVPFGELCESLRNGATIKQGKSCSGYPITRIETISGDVFNFDKMGFGDVFDIAPYEQFIMQPDDLLISHINSMKHLGRTVRFPGSDIPIIHGMNLLRARLNERCNPVYMEWLMKSDSTRAYIHSIAKQSVNQASFTVSALRKMPVKLPSLDLQNEFSCFVARIDKLRFDCQR